MVRISKNRRGKAGKAVRKGDAKHGSRETSKPARETPLIIGLAPDVADHRNSGFRAILKHFDPAAIRRTLEVGCFTGARTTVHLVDLLDTPVDIVEIDEGRARSVQEKFRRLEKYPGQVTVHNADVRAYHTTNKYDLIVLDLPTGMIQMAYLDLLDRLKPFANSGCKYILYTLYDCNAVFSAEKPPGNRRSQEQFMLDYFGSTELSFEKVADTMRPKGFHALGLVDNWMMTGDRGYGHVVLERRQ